MIKKISSIFIFFLAIVSCDLSKSSHSYTINKSKAEENNALIASTTVKDTTYYPKGIRQTLLRVGIANKIGDTIKINFAGGFMTGYSMTLKLYNGMASITLHEFSCTYYDEFIIENQEVVLSKTNYSVGEQLNAHISLVAIRNSKDTGATKDKVEIKGNFKIKVRDADDSYEDINYENTLAQLDTINVDTTTVLSIESCKFKNLPSQIIKLQNLEHLTVANNLIDTLDIGLLMAFKKLKYLNLNNNPISSLSSIENLTKLEFLELQTTNLKELPKGITRLRNLKYIGVCNTEIHEIPEELLYLKSLREICLPDSLVNKNHVVQVLRRRKIEFYE
jgi:Leucine-rich repeat (LRR) protein